MDIGIKEIDRWHRERGYFSAGYHFVIRRDGTVETGRKLDQPGAHARGWNHLSLGFCLVGGRAAKGKQAEQNFTPAQYAALSQLLHGLTFKYPNAQVVGHGDLPGTATACPSFDVPAWWASIRKRYEERT